MEANTDKQKTPDTGRSVSAPAPQKSSPKEEGLDFSKQQIAVASAKDRKTREHALALAVVIVLFIVIGLAVAGFLFIKPEPDRIQGQCDATEVRISGKLPGRVATIYVQEGQAVHAGDTLVRIHSSVAD
ncbi:MAG: biotin/lipoyl-binding protein, partial [Muribaculaceae bacterium]|nr:biotin/lipoyl-binding protein [Muribaculaceae bacterium]